MHKPGTFNLIYMHDVKLKYFYIIHDFFNACSISNINLKSHLCIKLKVQVYG